MKAADVLSELLEFRPELTESERPRRPWPIFYTYFVGSQQHPHGYWVCGEFSEAMFKT